MIEKKTTNSGFVMVNKVVPETMMEIEDKDLEKIFQETKTTEQKYNFYKKYSLTEFFIEKYIDEVDWKTICLFQRLNEYFIEKHTNNVDWNIISFTQPLGESFI